MAANLKSSDLQNQSADKKYYASGNRSAIQHSAADRVGRPGQPRRHSGTPRRVDPNVSMSGSDLPKSADVYYANDTKMRVPISPQAVTVVNQELLVAGTADIPAAFDAACQRLKAEALTIVKIATSELLAAFRRRVEFAVTREELTEDESRDIQLVLLPQPEPVVEAKPEEKPWEASSEPVTVADMEKVLVDESKPTIPEVPLAVRSHKKKNKGKKQAPVKVDVPEVAKEPDDAVIDPEDDTD